jgi:hypothetical protein
MHLKLQGGMLEVKVFILPTVEESYAPLALTHTLSILSDSITVGQWVSEEVPKRERTSTLDPMGPCLLLQKRISGPTQGKVRDWQIFIQKGKLGKVTLHGHSATIQKRHKEPSTIRNLCRKGK